MKEIFVDLFTNGLFIVPLGSWVFSQIVKVIINLFVERRFVFERLFGDGGMPSGHSATVSGLMFTSGWCYGFGSPIFAICAILAVIVMHDATGVRREAGKQATTIKQLTEAINGFITEKDQQVKAEKLKELVGHTPLQVFFGVVIGIIATVLYCLIGGVEYCSLQSIVF